MKNILVVLHFVCFVSADINVHASPDISIQKPTYGNKHEVTGSQQKTDNVLYQMIKKVSKEKVSPDGHSEHVYLKNERYNSFKDENGYTELTPKNQQESNEKLQTVQINLQTTQKGISEELNSLETSKTIYNYRNSQHKSKKYNKGSHHTSSQKVSKIVDTSRRANNNHQHANNKHHETTVNKVNTKSKQKKTSSNRTSTDYHSYRQQYNTNKHPLRHHHGSQQSTTKSEKREHQKHHSSNGHRRNINQIIFTYPNKMLKSLHAVNKNNKNKHLKQNETHNDIGKYQSIQKHDKYQQHQSFHQNHNKKAHLKHKQYDSTYNIHKTQKRNSKVKLQNLKADLEAEAFENELIAMLKGIETGKINATMTVILNGYVDRMFEHLRNIITKEDFNRLPLPQESVKVKHAAHCHLHHGTLKDIATIHRSDNVFFSYNPTEKKVTLGFPFKFSDLKIHYDYHVKFGHFFKSSGEVKGFIKNARFHPVFSYYFKSDRLTFDHFDMKRIGQLTVKFTGHKVYDWIINPVPKAFTHVFHSKIVHTLRNHVQAAIQKGTGQLNQNITRKIHHL